MKRKTYFVFFTMLVMAFGSFSVEGANLHAIIVADITDSSIGDSTAADLENMRKELRKAALYTGLDIKETIVKGNAVEPKNVLNKLKSLETEDEDVIFFYFSGHGFRTPGKGDSPWPNLYFSRVNKGVDYEEVGGILESYGPRLLVMISDACNNPIDDDLAPALVKRGFFKMWSEKDLENNYRKLFMDVKGTIMVTSSKAGEFSWGTNKGGLFTLAFIENLGKEVHATSEADWYSVLDNASNQIQADQHPDFRIFLEASN